MIKPTLEHLPSYVAALKRGWSPSTHEDNSREELQRIERNPVRFIELQEDRQAEGEPIRLDDGSFVPRLPGFRRWIWDGDFAGVIGLRWQPGSPELPPWCLGHIGYSVVEWKRRLGYATQALRLMLPEARKEGLPYLEIVTTPENEGSQRVITANGGLLVERFVAPQSIGGGETLRFRIAL
ncbi:MAG TPA: GNAT family N-acetyltransferase [Candidatus Nitrosotalea sp.]|nr:GNAT family N-acetyltransferase [Candidatus Nitrosotalea sp.]